jgi:hypothetical protein
VTGAGFFFGCSAAVAAAGNNAIRRISFPIRAFYRDQRGSKRAEPRCTSDAPRSK